MHGWLTKQKELRKKRFRANFVHVSERFSMPVYNLLAIYHFSRSDMGARGNSRESRKVSKGARSWIRAHDHDRRFPLSCSASTFVQSRCYASLSQPPTRPCSQSMHRRSLLVERTPDYGRRNRDDNTDKDGLS